ncbi:hypothetical protein Fcan01_24190 [Folsomia candida]|uniref:Uncharacterized protein n=1 Tax=Folsomia candida TaxID=158441 RepID=A0A226D6R4_FOLCA|nr:hypothetical protein Fcan01_24190 [Folsomia candida]
MATPRLPVCLFCRNGDCTSSWSDLFPQFLTYLATINIPVENFENFCPENFHSCQKCGSLLQTIAHHVHQLGEDLLTIYRVTLQNMNHNSDDDDDNIFEIWRRRSVSHSEIENMEQESPFKRGVNYDDVDIDIKYEVDQETQNLDFADDHHSPPEEEDEIPPEEDDESYLNDILELADDADDPPSPSRQASSSHKRQSTATLKPETTKILKLIGTNSIQVASNSFSVNEFDPKNVPVNLCGTSEIEIRDLIRTNFDLGVSSSVLDSMRFLFILP